MAVVQLSGLTKAYGDQLAVRELNLEIASGEFFSFLGPSGCGKTTTLRMIAGFVQPDRGRILIDGQDIVDQPPEKRDLGIVFQNYAIFPHMNVAENIGFGMRMRKIDKATIERQVGQALEQVGLSGYEKRYSQELSGGQQQRVALARVLVTRPRILLLDEPLSALDKNLREEMKIWITGLQKQLKITTIYVTHDQSEALTMSDRIGVMNKGRMVQVGTPAEVYETPADLFVTTFIGHSNLLDGRVESVNGSGALLSLGEGVVVPAPAREGIGAGAKVKLVIRPENVLFGEGGEGLVRLAACVEARAYQGAAIRYRLNVAGQTLMAETLNQAGRPLHAVGANLKVCWRPESTEILANEEP